MEWHAVPTLALPSLAHDALIVVGAGSALLAGLVFLNLGLLLPGLLTSLGGHQGDPRGASLEFGPAAAPLISEPAPRRVAQPKPLLDRHRPARPHLWRHLAGVAITPLAPPVHTVRR